MPFSEALDLLQSARDKRNALLHSLPRLFLLVSMLLSALAVSSCFSASPKTKNRLRAVQIQSGDDAPRNGSTLSRATRSASTLSPFEDISTAAAKHRRSISPMITLSPIPSSESLDSSSLNSSYSKNYQQL